MLHMFNMWIIDVPDELPWRLWPSPPPPPGLVHPNDPFQPLAFAAAAVTMRMGRSFSLVRWRPFNPQSDQLGGYPSTS